MNDLRCKIIEVSLLQKGYGDIRKWKMKKYAHTFKIDLQDFILNCSNLIPEKTKSNIDFAAIIEKMSGANLHTKTDQRCFLHIFLREEFHTAFLGIRLAIRAACWFP